MLLTAAMALGPSEPEYQRYRLSNVDGRIGLLPQGRLPFIEAIDSAIVEACNAQYEEAVKQQRQEEDAEGASLRQAELARLGCLAQGTWALPYSSLKATQEVARELRRAWQRFEERYYWRTITELNNPSFYLALCAIGFNAGSLNPPLPQPNISVELASIPPFRHDPSYQQRLTDKLGVRLPAGTDQHNLDFYLPLPLIPREDFCDELGVALFPIMFIPSFCVNIRPGGFRWCTPGYPNRPLWFNQQEADRRIERAIERAIERYYAEYLLEVQEILMTPRFPGFSGEGVPEDPEGINADNWELFLPVPWSTNLTSGGAVIAPVAPGVRPPQTIIEDVIANLEQIWQTIDKGREAFSGGVRALLQGYYVQSFVSLAESYGGTIMQVLPRNLHTLPLDASRTALRLEDLRVRLANEGAYLRRWDGWERSDDDAANGSEQERFIAAGAPGSFPFEELKRFFPVGELIVQEHLGFSSIFFAYDRMDATVLPTPNRADRVFAALIRTIGYWWTPVQITITIGINPPITVSGQIERPRMLAQSPYLLPFLGARTYWAWENVPEGYPIPRVQGAPLEGYIEGYRRLLRR